MGLFGKPKDERKELNGKIKKLMKDYDKEKIDGATYAEKMMDLSKEYNPRYKKKK